MNTYNVCSDCADIISIGYTDGIESIEEHQKRCNYIDKRLLPAGHYWLETCDVIREDYFTKCEGCGAAGIDYLCYSSSS